MENLQMSDGKNLTLYLSVVSPKPVTHVHWPITLQALVHLLITTL